MDWDESDRPIKIEGRQPILPITNLSFDHYSGATWRRMKDWTVKRERYLRESIPNRLGELAANLSRIASFCSNDLNCDAVASLVEESKFFIEWTAIDTGIDQAAELVEVQVQLARWQLGWSSIWVNEAKRKTVAEQTKSWSEYILGMSGILTESVASQGI
jgi:hypothetical protein